MGKGKVPFQRFFSYIVAAGILLPGIGCGTSDPALILQSGRVFGLIGLEGRWVGKVSPTGPNCGASSTGLMSASRDKFAFDPFQSTTIIHGDVVKGRLTGRLERIGGDHRVSAIELDAQATTGSDGNQSIQGELKSGSCQWHIELHPG